MSYYLTFRGDALQGIVGAIKRKECYYRDFIVPLHPELVIKNMGRSQETFGKKEVRNKKEKKRKEKEQKRAKKKSEGKKSNFDDMIAYVDEFGMISSTPPDPDKKTVVVAENIELKITKNKPDSTPDFVRKGVITFFNESKGYGFIRDLESNQSVFVHANSLQEPVKENNVVIFEIGKGPKGPSAMKVRLFKE